MVAKHLKIEGLILIEKNVISDERGSFTEKYNKHKFNKLLNYNIDFIQDNEVISQYGVLRGMHYQIAPFAQSKLIRVIKGEILDIVVDCRKNSPTFGKYLSIKLSSSLNNQLLIPKGLAHGYISLSSDCIVEFKVDNKYSPEHIQGFRYNDKTINIDWQFNEDNMIISSADKMLPFFNELIYFE